jgi:hypothetical protein
LTTDNAHLLGLALRHTARDCANAELVFSLVQRQLTKEKNKSVESIKGIRFVQHNFKFPMPLYPAEFTEGNRFFRKIR